MARSSVTRSRSFSPVWQFLFNATDLVVVGQFCDSLSVAAVGSIGSTTTLLIKFFIGLSVGISVTVVAYYFRTTDCLFHCIQTMQKRGYQVIPAFVYVIKLVHSRFSFSGRPKASLPSAILFIRKVIFSARTRIVCKPSASSVAWPGALPCTLFQY